MLDFEDSIPFCKPIANPLRDCFLVWPLFYFQFQSAGLSKGSKVITLIWPMHQEDNINKDLLILEQPYFCLTQHQPKANQKALSALKKDYKAKCPSLSNFYLIQTSIQALVSYITNKLQKRIKHTNQKSWDSFLKCMFQQDPGFKQQQ